MRGFHKFVFHFHELSGVSFSLTSEGCFACGMVYEPRGRVSEFRSYLVLQVTLALNFRVGASVKVFKFAEGVACFHSLRRVGRVGAGVGATKPSQATFPTLRKAKLKFRSWKSMVLLSKTCTDPGDHDEGHDRRSCWK